MKKLFLFLLFATTLMFGQIPQGISHRGTVYNPTTGAIIVGPVTIRISILENNASGSMVYQETHSVTTNAQGQYSLNIGKGTPVSPYIPTSFSTINWGGITAYLKVEIDPAGGTNYSVVGSNQLMSVPYALYSKDSKNSVMLDNINALKAYTNLEANKEVYVKGYYKPGDGGGGLFRYNAASKSETDLGINFKPNSLQNSDSGRWVRQYSGYLNVAYFGIVKFELPNTYDTLEGEKNHERLQNAIDYCYHNSKEPTYVPPPPFINDTSFGDFTIYFPEGVYWMYPDKSIIIRSRTHIKGDTSTFIRMGNSTIDYLFKIDKGPIKNISIENLRFDLFAFDPSKNPVNHMGWFYVEAQASTDENSDMSGGVYGGIIKDVYVENVGNHGIYFRGGDTADGGEFAKEANQFVYLDNVWIERGGDDLNSFRLFGLNVNLTFNNCNPTARTFLEEVPTMKGAGFYVGSTSSNPPANNISIVFTGCDAGGAPGGPGEFGYEIHNAQNVIIQNAWIEDSECGIVVKNSDGVSILDNHFANAAANGSLKQTMYPDRNSACIVVENSFVTIERNDVSISDPYKQNVENELFIRGDGENNVINANNNYFKHIKSSNTYGISQAVAISNINNYSLTPMSPFATISGIETGGKKIVGVKSGLNNTISRINSTISAGETLLIRAEEADIIINEMYPISFPSPIPSGFQGRNIWLGGLGTITLKLGQVAYFMKTDGLLNGERSFYQLVSKTQSNTELNDSGWINVSSFSNGCTSYDANSTVRFRKKNGIVILDGNIKGGAIVANWINGTMYNPANLLFTLPSGYRPTKATSLQIIRAGNAVSGVPTTTVVGRIDINTDGKVYGVNYSNVWNSLSGIQFFTD